MSICLVTAPTATESGLIADLVADAASVFYPSLGVLSLAAAIRQLGQTPQVINLNRLYYAFVTLTVANLDQGRQQRGIADEFECHAVRTLQSSGCDVFGFSSICSSYPLSIRIAKGLKRVKPNCTIIFGGPQASVVDRETLAAFPFIDFILRGEADETLPILLSELAGASRFSSVPGLTHRTPFGIVRNGGALVIENLDLLPIPDYGLEGDVTNLRVAPIEAGRGCPFDCTFCSTNDFFRRRFRMKSPERLLDEMRVISAKWGCRTFELTHDMYTVDRKRVEAFCETLLGAGDGFRWSCSARSDFVDEALIALMARAGCIGLFFGIESGSVRIQKVIRKDLDPDRARDVIACADGRSIKCTVSLIMGFPEETWIDVEASLGVFMFALSCENAGPQLAVLAPLAATPIHAEHKDSLILDDLCSDSSYQGRSQNETDRELIRNYPDIFPNFYLLPTPNLDSAALMELHEFMKTAPVDLRWLLVALHREKKGLLEVFFKWREYRIRYRPGLRSTAMREYYISRASRDEFVLFLSGIREEFQDPAVQALIQFHQQASQAFPASRRAGQDVLLPIADPDDWNEDDIPSLTPATVVIAVDWNIGSVIESLRHGRSSHPEKIKSYYLRHPLSEDVTRVVSITPLAASALRLCDGKTELADVIALLVPLLDTVPGKYRRYAGLELIQGLQGKGYLEIHRKASDADPSQGSEAFAPEYSAIRAAASARNHSLAHSE